MRGDRSGSRCHEGLPPGQHRTQQAEGLSRSSGALQHGIFPAPQCLDYLPYIHLLTFVRLVGKVHFHTRNVESDHLLRGTGARSAESKSCAREAVPDPPPQPRPRRYSTAGATRTGNSLIGRLPFRQPLRAQVVFHLQHKVEARKRLRAQLIDGARAGRPGASSRADFRGKWPVRKTGPHDRCKTSPTTPLYHPSTSQR